MFFQNKPLSIIRNTTPILGKVHGNRIYPSKQGLDKILLVSIEQTRNRSRSPARAKRGDEMPAGEVSWIKIF